MNACRNQNILHQIVLVLLMFFGATGIGVSFAHASAPIEDVSGFSPAGYALYPKPDAKFDKDVFNNGFVWKWKEKDWKKFNPLIKDLSKFGNNSFTSGVMDAWYDGTPSPATCFDGIPMFSGEYGHGKCMTLFNGSKPSGLRIAAIQASANGAPTVRDGVSLTIRIDNKKSHWAYEGESDPTMTVEAGETVTIDWACQPNQSTYHIYEYKKGVDNWGWTSLTFITLLADRSRSPTGNISGTGNGKLHGSDTVAPAEGKTTSYSIQCGGYEPELDNNDKVPPVTSSIDNDVVAGNPNYGGCGYDFPCYKGYAAFDSKNSSYYHPVVTVNIKVCQQGAQITNGKCGNPPPPPPDPPTTRIKVTGNDWGDTVTVAYGTEVTLRANTKPNKGDSVIKTGIWEKISGGSDKKRAVANGKDAYFTFTANSAGTRTFYPQTKTDTYGSWENHSNTSVKVKVCAQGEIVVGTSCGKPTVTIKATDKNANEENGDPGVFTIDRGAGNTAGGLTVTFSVSSGGTNATRGGTGGGDYHLEEPQGGSIGDDASVKNDTTVIIPDTKESIDVDVVPHNDTIPDDNETVTLTLVNQPEYKLDSNQKEDTVTIHDNDTLQKPDSQIQVKRSTDSSWSNSNILIAPGQDIYIKWWDANNVAISCNSFGFPLGASPPAGGVQQSVDEPAAGDSSTYYISCSNSNGDIDESKHLKVTAIGDVILTADDTNVRAGQSVKLTWDTGGRDGSTCSIMRVSGVQLPGDYSTLSGPKGTIPGIDITAKSEYSLTCAAADGLPAASAPNVIINIIPTVFES